MTTSRDRQIGMAFLAGLWVGFLAGAALTFVAVHWVTR